MWPLMGVLDQMSAMDENGVESSESVCQSIFLY